MFLPPVNDVVEVDANFVPAVGRVPAFVGSDGSPGFSRRPSELQPGMYPTGRFLLSASVLLHVTVTPVAEEKHTAETPVPFDWGL